MARSNTETELRAVASDVIQRKDGALDRAVAALLAETISQRKLTQDTSDRQLEMASKLDNLVSNERCMMERQKINFAQEMLAKELSGVYVGLPQLIETTAQNTLQKTFEHSADKILLKLREQMKLAIREDTCIIRIGHQVNQAHDNFVTLNNKVDTHINEEKMKPSLLSRVSQSAKQWGAIITLLATLLVGLGLTARYIVYMSDAVDDRQQQRDKQIEQLIKATETLVKDQQPNRSNYAPPQIPPK